MIPLFLRTSSWLSSPLCTLSERECERRRNHQIKCHYLIASSSLFDDSSSSYIWVAACWLALSLPPPQHSHDSFIPLTIACLHFTGTCYWWQWHAQMMGWRKNGPLIIILCKWGTERRIEMMKTQKLCRSICKKRKSWREERKWDSIRRWDRKWKAWTERKDTRGRRWWKFLPYFHQRHERQALQIVTDLRVGKIACKYEWNPIQTCFI